MLFEDLRIGFVYWKVGDMIRRHELCSKIVSGVLSRSLSVFDVVFVVFAKESHERPVQPPSAAFEVQG